MRTVSLNRGVATSRPKGTMFRQTNNRKVICLILISLKIDLAPE
jgi:hypothetical protein